MKYTSEYIAQVKRDFLRSIEAGYSVTQSISHANCHCKKFRDLFRGDEHIQKILFLRREASRQVMRGYIKTGEKK